MYFVVKTQHGTAYVVSPTGVRVSEIPTSVAIARREAVRMNRAERVKARKAVNLTALEREVIRMRCKVQTLQIAASGIWHPLPGF